MLPFHPLYSRRSITTYMLLNYVHESVATGIMRIAFIPSSENLADMFTKLLGATKLKSFTQRILYLRKKKQIITCFVFGGLFKYYHAKYILYLRPSSPRPPGLSYQNLSACLVTRYWPSVIFLIVKFCPHNSLLCP